LAGISKWFHGLFYDNYFMQYRAFRRKEVIHFSQNEMMEIKNKLKNTKNILEIISLSLYGVYTRVQTALFKIDPQINPKKYCEMNRVPLLLWGMIGSSAHIMMMVMASFLFSNTFFVFSSVVFGNIWALSMLLYQYRIHKILVKNL
jgi:hypothetical protein